MLHHDSLPPSFWGETISTAIYLLNRSTTKALQGMTPEEAFTGNKPCVSHLCVFRCLAHVHVPSHKRRTFGAKSTPMIFTSYATHSKGFHFWNPNKNDIVLSCDAVRAHGE